MEPMEIQESNGSASPSPAPSSAAPPNDTFLDTLKLEHQFLRVPFEHLKKTMRTSSRTAEKELAAVLSGVSDAASKDLSREEAVAQLDALVSRLQSLKRKSKLEFKLRAQEFIELVRAEKMLEAVAYARRHLAPWSGTHMKELQQAMATLAFRSTTDCAGYKARAREKKPTSSDAKPQP
eukprot:jgi/Mesen1/4852/ME000244S04028